LANVISAGLGFPVAAVAADLLGVKGAFWLAFAFTLVSVVVAWRVIEPGPSGGDGPVDIVGALLLGATTFGMLFAISRADAWGYTSSLLLGVLATSVVLLAASIWWLLRSRNPLVDLRIAVRPGVLGAHVAAMLGGVGMYLMMATVMVLV